MKNFYLINSPIYWEVSKEQEQYLSPLGLGYIATYLEMENINVKILDCVKDKISPQEVIATINNRSICISFAQ